MNKRATFVIGTDGTLVDVISSETNMDVHADKALAALSAEDQRQRRNHGTWGRLRIAGAPISPAVAGPRSGA